MNSIDQNVQKFPFTKIYDLYQFVVMNISWYTDVFFSKFVYHFKCIIFNQYHCNSYSAYKNTLMKFIWVYIFYLTNRIMIYYYVYILFWEWQDSWLIQRGCRPLTQVPQHQVCSNREGKVETCGEHSESQITKLGAYSQGVWWVG